MKNVDRKIDLKLKVLVARDNFETIMESMCVLKEISDMQKADKKYIDHKVNFVVGICESMLNLLKVDI